MQIGFAVQTDLNKLRFQGHIEHIFHVNYSLTDEVPAVGSNNVIKITDYVSLGGGTLRIIL